ncbi:MAG: ABC transporter substrate-binding protein [Anaerolineales bacterium]
MATKNRLMAAFSTLAIAAFLLAACAPGGVTVVETQIVERVVTQEVEVVVQAEAYTTPHPILSDIRVRKAIAFCSNRPEMIASVYTFVDDPNSLLMDTFIPSDHWAHAAGVEQYAFDPAQGAALLDEAGWTLAEGADVRQNAAGEALALHFTTTSAAFRQTWAAVFESNMADCGIQVVRLHAPASWWFGDTTGLSRRDFELGAFAWVGEADPGGETLYACDGIPLPSNGWSGQNYMGWCNEAASVAIRAANNTLDRDERIAQYAITQQEFAKDMPSLPLFNRVEVLATNKDLAGFAPAPGEPYATYNIHEWEIAGLDTIVLGYTQEPASLFTLVENAFVAVNAYITLGGYPVSSLNYDFQANMYVTQLPTLDNGGATLATVDVAEGTTVVDTSGAAVALASGVTVKDADGNDVAFSGGTVPMQQMTLNWELVPGITFSDGAPVTAADIDLATAINCSPDSGATDFTTCDRTASAVATDTSLVVTLVPGYTPPLYFTVGNGGCSGPCWYPAHRVLSDGRTLADVPASEWTTLPEIAESPIDTGAYMITEWVKGQSMTFEANPFFYLGAPKTPTIVIKFVADTNQAVAQLLTGQVDVLFGETLGAGAEVQTVRDAADAGEVAIYILPSATWEHIDFNLFTR